MATPDQQWNLGTEALNGRDGDTARAAGVKYNAHAHQTAAVQAALDGATTPSESNVFATMADIPPDELTASELAAIQGAASPSGSNVFATMADLSGGPGPGGSFTHNPLHWQAASGVEGVGTTTPLSTTSYPDLSSADGGKALAALNHAGAEGLWLDADVSTDPTKPAGIDLGDLGVGVSGARAVYLQPYIRTTSTVGDINDAYDWHVGIYCFQTNTAGAFVGGGVKQFVSEKAASASLFWWSATDRNQAYNYTNGLGYSAPPSNDGFALFIERDGSSGDVIIWIGNGLARRPIFRSPAFSTGAVKFALMLHGDTSTVPVGVFVENIGSWTTIPTPALTV